MFVKNRDMKWFNFFNRRSADDFEKAIVKAIREDDSFSGGGNIHVSEQGSLSLSAVWRCVAIIADTTAITPIHLYRKTENGRERENSHQAKKLLSKPNTYQNKFDVLHHLMVSVCLWGNGYARIYRDNLFQPTRLKLLHPQDVTPVLIKDDLFYRINSSSEIVASYDMLHVKNLCLDGVIGKSPIAVHRDNLSLSFSAQKYGETFFTQGGNTEGVIKLAGTLKEDAFQRLKTEVYENIAGMRNSHKPLILEGGADYQRINIPPEDAQFIATRKFQKTEIATIYGVPPHMIADLERSTNNNIEHQGMEFVTYCLMPYLQKIEEEFNSKLLREDDADKLYFKFSLNGLLRGDAKTRSEYYKNMNLIGAMTANEIRAFEDMNSYEGGEEHFVQMNMQTIKNAKNNVAKTAGKSERS